MYCGREKGRVIFAIYITEELRECCKVVILNETNVSNMVFSRGVLD